MNFPSKNSVIITIIFACFTSIFSAESYVNSILQNSYLPAGGTMLAALGDRNGESVTESDLRSTSFWNDANRINWNVSSVIGDTVGNPWMLPNQRSALPIHRKEQIDYKDLVEMTVTISSPIQYKSLLGLYGYKLNITLGNDLDFGGDTISPLFNVISFNGNNKTISNFTLKSDCEMSGLLANVKNSVFDLNVKINDYIATMTFNKYMGVLVGKLDGNMWNCHVSNTSGSNITVSGVNNVGALAGYVAGSISNCSVSKIDVNASGLYAGGLAGYAGGDVTDCFAFSTNVITYSQHVGGLVGFASGNITDCKVTDGIVSGNLDVGGLVGSHSSSGALTNDTIVHVYVTARNGQAGGLAAISGATVTNCRIDSSSVSGKNSVGGLIGYFTGTISECHADSVQVKANGEYAGGLFGRALSSGTISKSSVTRAIIFANSNYAGGLTGRFPSTVSECTVRDVRVTAIGNYAGGFYGFAGANGAIEIGSIRNAIITANNGNAGGLSANGNNGDISNVTAVKVRVSATLQAGGLSASTGGKITSCSIDSSTVNGGSNVGGLAGYFSGKISDCHADSLRVTTTGDFAGGFYGFANSDGAIEKSSIREAIIKANGISSRAGGLSANGSSGNIFEVTAVKVRVKSNGEAGGLSASTSGNITNCSIDSSTVEGGSNSNAGGLAGFLGGTANGCSVDSLTITGNYAGGIYGWGTGSAAYDTIMRVNIKAGTSAGGIAGYSTNSTGSNRTFANLQIESASITSNGDCAGGVVGYTDDKEDIFTNINITSITVEAVNYAGGIAGNTLGGSDKITDVEITNYSINATASGSYAGGIVASFAGNSIARCTVKGINTYTISIKGGSQVGGIVADAKMSTSIGNNITDCHISDAALTLSGSKDYIGGIAGNCSAYSLTNSTVTDVKISGEKYVGGIVGRSVVHNLLNCSVVGAEINCSGNTNHYAGGIVGSGSGSGSENDSKIGGAIVSNSKIITNASLSGAGGIAGIYDGNYIDACGVINKTIVIGGLQVGGVVGVTNSSISNCHVDAATLEMQGASNFGGIAGISSGYVGHSLVSGVTMKCDNSNADAAYIGGIVGYNNSGGTITNCVSMIKYFEIKAKYTKSGGHLGRIVASSIGSLNHNYGWVETYIKYHHKRFGINWDDSYYKGTGGVAVFSRNGGNLYVGSEYKSDAESASPTYSYSGLPAFWNGLGFGSMWKTAEVSIETTNPNFYPKLKSIDSTCINNNIGSARGFEYETKLIGNLGSNSVFTSGIVGNNNIEIHTPKILFAKTFSTSGQPALQVQDLNLTLYTDIALAVDNGLGNSTFWSVDLNEARSGTITASPFVFTTASAGTSLTFDGKGHCIDNFYKVDYNSTNIPEGSNHEGLICASYNIPLTIQRLELENPIFYKPDDRVAPATRFGFLLSSRYYSAESTPIYAERSFYNIYIKSPSYDAASTSYSIDGHVGDPSRVDFNGTFGTISGWESKIIANNLALYMPDPSKSHIHVHYIIVGGFFGYVSTYANLSGAKIAISMNSSLVFNNRLDNSDYWDKNSSNIFTVSSYPNWNYDIGKPLDPYKTVMGTGYLIGACPYLPSPHYSLSTFIKISDGSNAIIPPGNENYCVPFINKLGMACVKTGISFPNYADFPTTLRESGLKDDNNWHYSTVIDSIYLNRETHSWYW